MDPVTQIYQFLDSENIKEANMPFRPTDRYRLSELGNCARRIRYRHIGYPGLETRAEEPTPGFVSLYGQDGDIAHDSVRWLMKKAGVELGGLDFNEQTGEIKETIFFRKTVNHKDQDLTISGRLDGVVKIDGEWQLLEIKSIDGWKSQYLGKAYNKGEVLDYIENGSSGKMAKFLAQCEATMQLVEYEGQPLTKTCLVMKDRSLCQIGCHDIKHKIRESITLHRDDERWESILNKLALVERSKTDGTDLMRHPDDSHWECGQCDYSNHCWKGQK